MMSRTPIEARRASQDSAERAALSARETAQPTAADRAMAQPYRLDDLNYDELTSPVRFNFEMRRRGFVQSLGAGLLVTVGAGQTLGQRRRRAAGERQAEGPPVSARLHVGENGVVTVMAGKTEMGQGARAELAQAAAEELRLPTGQVQMLLADTDVVPNDGLTAGSRTTPETVPAVRQAAAAVRQLLIAHASEQWNVDAAQIEIRDGLAAHPQQDESLGYDALAQSGELASQLSRPVPSDVQLTPIADWQVLGTSVTAASARDFVTGAHRYPTDCTRPGMLYGAVLRPASFGAKPQSIELDAARAMDGVVVVQDGDFVGVAAPTSMQARSAIEALAESAQWDSPPHPSSEELFEYLRENAEGGTPPTPSSDQMQQASKSLEASYEVAYVQHAPLEPRTALAEWTEDGKLTIWTGTQNPFGVRREVSRAFQLAEEDVRVVVPDFGSGYGGKHTGESAVEAARLARGAGKPVMHRWSREEEFTWAYFRPAALIDLAASLDEDNQLTSWRHLNVNSGRSALQTPYVVAKNKCETIRTKNTPLRQGSYRALAATANVFARESFMDELADTAGVDPLEFRLKHLEPGRLRDALEDAAERFGWQERVRSTAENRGVGLACGTDKGSFVAACVEIEIGRRNAIEVVEVCQTFDCGKVLNPDNLLRQVQGAIVQGLGPALTEAIEFENGQIANAAFRRYETPRIDQLPKLDIHLFDRQDAPSAGAGETPLIAVAAAIGNAVFHATGQRVRQMPVKLA